MILTHQGRADHLCLLLHLLLMLQDRPRSIRINDTACYQLPPGFTLMRPTHALAAKSLRNPNAATSLLWTASAESGNWYLIYNNESERVRGPHKWSRTAGTIIGQLRDCYWPLSEMLWPILDLIHVGMAACHTQLVRSNEQMRLMRF